jgi:transcriptional regulator with XRE-family HTH domain
MTTHTTNSTSHVSFDIRAIRSLLEMSRESRTHLLHALANCSEQVQQMLIDLVAIADNPDSTEEDKALARATIYETLDVHCRRGAYGVSLSNIESGTVGQSPDADRISQQMDSQEEQFAQKLRELMKAKGLTQMELARRSDCTQPAISQMLTRRCRPQKRTILKLADALGVAPTDLWPDLDVADILDTVAAVQTDDEPLSPEEAAAIQRTMHREATSPAGKPLPKFKR